MRKVYSHKKFADGSIIVNNIAFSHLAFLSGMLIHIVCVIVYFFLPMVNKHHTCKLSK